MVVLALITGFVLRWTRFGRHVYAIGGNEHAATLTGVPVQPIKVAVYMISALSAGIAGIIQTGWLGAITTNIGAGLELQVIAAAVIGGANLAGGVGTAFGALIGAALIEAIRNSLGLLGINAFWQGTFIGGAIILAGAVRPHPQFPPERIAGRQISDFSVSRAACPRHWLGPGHRLRARARHGAAWRESGASTRRTAGQDRQGGRRAARRGISRPRRGVRRGRRLAVEAEVAADREGRRPDRHRRQQCRRAVPRTARGFPDDKWQELLQTNVTGVFNVGKAVARRMIRAATRQDHQHRLGDERTGAADDRALYDDEGRGPKPHAQACALTGRGTASRSTRSRRASSAPN